MTKSGVEIKDQQDKYVMRVSELEELNYWDFFLDTYEHSESKNTDSRTMKADKGFPPLPGSRSSKARCVRQQGHETLPEFIGQWFPRRSDIDAKELYSVSMLALFKPWRDLGDLKLADETFEDAFSVFMEDAPKEYSRIMDNMEYFYLSAASANITDEEATKGPDPERATLAPADEDVMLLIASGYDTNAEVDEETMENALANIYTPGDRLFAMDAMDTALASGIFSANEGTAPKWKPLAQPATQEQLHQYAMWEDHVRNYIRGEEFDGDKDCNNFVAPTLETPALDTSPEPNETDFAEIISSDIDLRGVSRSAGASPSQIVLNDEQARAHAIIKYHMLETARLDNNEQLLMIVDGCGGTGKSALIEAITDTSKQLGIGSCLAKTATSGVAATRIGGTTVHSWAGLGITLNVETSNQTTLAKRAKNIGRTKYLIIDEFSMLTKRLLEALSAVCCLTKCALSTCTKGLFGGINIILFGDLHQFPPIVKSGALYHISANEDSFRRHIFEQFKIVVTLTQQMRV